MPPKVKTTKEAIVAAAVDIVRGNGAEALNARTVAAALGCSTQPVFSNFATMEELRLAVVEQAGRLSFDYRQQEMERGDYPPYKASGVAYIRFAKEEKELFKLLYMRDRSVETAQVEDFDSEITAVVQKATGLDAQNARLFHLEMWAYVHGIATMIVTGFLELEWDLISRITSDAYQGLRKQYGLE